MISGIPSLFSKLELSVSRYEFFPFTQHLFEINALSFIGAIQDVIEFADHLILFHVPVSLHSNSPVFSYCN